MSAVVVTLPVIRIERFDDPVPVHCGLDLNTYNKLNALAVRWWGRDLRACASDLLRGAVNDASRGRRP